MNNIHDASICRDWQKIQSDIILCSSVVCELLLVCLQLPANYSKVSIII